MDSGKILLLTLAMVESVSLTSSANSKTDASWCLPRITQPEPVQALLLEQLHWHLPDQPPPRIYTHQVNQQ